jgi:hypothetical protein
MTAPGTSPGTRNEVVVCTATDDGYAEMALELIASLRDFPEGRQVDVGLIDLGLTEAWRGKLAEAADKVEPGRWDIPLSARRVKGRDFLIGRICKLFLPDYFPGYETYVWIDSDAWLCDWAAMELLLRGSASKGFAAVPDDWETDRIKGALTLRHRWLPPIFKTPGFKHGHRAGLSTAELRALFRRKEFNGGVYAVRGDAPHWASFQANMRRLLSKRGRIFGSNQLALTMAVVLDRLPVAVLPYRVNYTGWPMADPATGRLVMPHLPHEPVGIMHLANRDAQRADRTVEDDLETPPDGSGAGGTLRRTIRYRPEDTAAAQASRKSAAK